MYHVPTKHAAKNKWRGILMNFGIDGSHLVNKHGPCPICGGVDRFRWDNKGGDGTFICGHCGSGSGADLAMLYTGKTFKEISDEIDAIVGNIREEAPRRELSEQTIRDILRDTWKQTQEVQPGDLVHKYLATRKVDELIYPKALRFAPALRDGDGGVRPCMVAMVGLHGQDKFVSMHRTFLRPDGSGKADMPSPRKAMPGELPDGACVMLSEYTSGALGIAEGIETALSASAIFQIPVWSALNSSMLARWVPPAGCEEVAIFGDNDAKFGGQSAAYQLAHKLACKGVTVTVHVPVLTGEDWADVHMRGGWQ